MKRSEMIKKLERAFGWGTDECYYGLAKEVLDYIEELGMKPPYVKRDNIVEDDGSTTYLSGHTWELENET